MGDTHTISTRAERIVISMSSFSSVASTLVEKLNLNPHADTDDVAELKHQLETITALVHDLYDEIEHLTSTEFTQHEQEVFEEHLYNNLMRQNYMTLQSFYTARFFEDLSKNVRLILASALVSVCSKRGFNPEPVWQSIVSNSGQLIL